MSAIRIVPATSRFDLVFNAGEDIDILIVVEDKLGQAVPLQSAVATIGTPGCDPKFVWSVDDGSLELGAGFGEVVLHSTAAQTLAWLAWGDSEWQLDTRDIFGRRKRPVEGDVTVRATRQGES